MSIAPNTPQLAELLSGRSVLGRMTVDDLKGATEDFYTGLFGWDYADDERLHRSPWWTACPSPDCPPGEPDELRGWTLFLTPHARATAEKAFHLGGLGAAQPEDAADHTQSTVIGDPTGAVVGFRHVPPDWRFGTSGPRRLRVGRAEHP